MSAVRQQPLYRVLETGELLKPKHRRLQLPVATITRLSVFGFHRRRLFTALHRPLILLHLNVTIASADLFAIPLDYELLGFACAVRARIQQVVRYILTTGPCDAQQWPPAVYVIGTHSSFPMRFNSCRSFARLIITVNPTLDVHVGYS